MLSFKFQYLTKPTKEYKLEYGLKSKGRPYSFNYPVGLKCRTYKFDYDRRDEIYIEERDQSFVFWGRDMHLEENTNPLIKRIYEMEVEEEKELEKIIKKKILSEVSIGLKRNRNKDIYIEKSLDLEKIKLKYLDIYKSLLLKRNNMKELIRGSFEYALNFEIQSGIAKDKRLKALDTLEGEVEVDRHSFTLEAIKKSLEKELRCLLYKNNTFKIETENESSKLEDNALDLWYKETERVLNLNLLKGLNKDADIDLINDFIRNLGIDKKVIDLTKEEYSEIDIKSIVLLSKLNNEININREYGPSFKVLNEVYKYKELTSRILFLYSLYDLEKEDGFVGMKPNSVKMDKFVERYLDKNFEVDLKIDSDIKMLINNTKHNLWVEVKEKLLKDETIHEADIEKCFKQLEEVYGIIIDIENRMKQLGKEHIVDLYKEQDVYQLIKKLVIHDLITEDESIEFKKSPIGKILLENSMALKKNQKEIEIIIDESIPMVKAYKEIIINNDIKATKEAIEIDIDKEKEFKKVVSEIEIEASEETIKFNKRFWFLRATDPFDLKILPYSDYPYKSDPIMFDSEKLIPDNWQLDLIPGLHKEIKEHPIPFGSNLGREEMTLSIEIIIDVINIMILIWSRMFYNFSGYTGSQAVIRFTKILYDWLMLEESLEEMNEKGSTEHYFRCYNWIRWEAEKVAIKARDDMSLSGNMYIDEWIFELIYYMENHHFDTMPIFDVVQKMDEYRAQLPTDDPQGDINFILDKVKGMRHKIIECKANKSNE